MKKRFGMIVLISVILSVTAAISVAAESGFIRGDADGDGEVTIFDATAIQRKLANLPTSSFIEKASDVDGNGLDITDATKIQRYLAQFTDPYQINEFVSDNTQPTREDSELPFVPI